MARQREPIDPFEGLPAAEAIDRLISSAMYRAVGAEGVRGFLASVREAVDWRREMAWRRGDYMNQHYLEEVVALLDQAIELEP